MCIFFVQNILAYAPIRNATVETTKHMLAANTAKALLFGGLSKLGITPGGGAWAGPLRIASCWASGSRWSWSSDISWVGDCCGLAASLDESWVSSLPQKEKGKEKIDHFGLIYLKWVPEPLYPGISNPQCHYLNRANRASYPWIEKMPPARGRTMF